MWVPPHPNRREEGEKEAQRGGERVLYPGLVKSDQEKTTILHKSMGAP